MTIKVFFEQRGDKKLKNQRNRSNVTLACIVGKRVGSRKFFRKIKENSFRNVLL